MIITILGYMGSGKTTIGKILSQNTKLNYLDLDKYIEEKQNLELKEIFKKKGEVYFRKIEHQYLINLLENSKNQIISLGGGTPAYYKNIDIINQLSESFYLKLPINELYKRLKFEKKQRPILSHLKDENLKEFISKHIFERDFFYRQAKHTINVYNKTPHIIAEEISNKLSLSN